MSKEYIEREAIDKLVKEIKPNFAPLHRLVLDAFIYAVIDKVPTADVEPVRHGKWVEKHRGAKSPEGYYYWNTPLTYVFVCSECGRKESKKEPYCNCGAKMELDKGKDLWIVRKGKRKILAVEVPKKLQSYYDDLKDNAKTLRDVFG